jgi:hypothetical protein
MCVFSYPSTCERIVGGDWYDAEADWTDTNVRSVKASQVIIVKIGNLKKNTFVVIVFRKNTQTQISVHREEILLKG